MKFKPNFKVRNQLGTQDVVTSNSSPTGAFPMKKLYLLRKKKD